MGRKAKLKKMRRENPQDSSASKPELDSTQFVKQLERKGYQLKRMQHSPELPDNNPKPQL
ncbi:MAG: hypothetical protein ACOC04_01435 [Halothece sp.]